MEHTNAGRGVRAARGVRPQAGIAAMDENLHAPAQNLLCSPSATLWYVQEPGAADLAEGGGAG